MSSADRRGPFIASVNWLRTKPQRYGFAVCVVAAASVVHYTLIVTIGPLLPFVMLIPSLGAVAVLAGFWPGVLATLLSAGSVATFFWTSQSMFGSYPVRESLGLAAFCGVGIPISALADRYRRHVARRRESERAVEGVEEMLVVVDRDYRCRIANNAFLSYRGAKREDLIGRRIPEVFKPCVSEPITKAKLDECFRGKVVQFEITHDYPGRGERQLSVTYFPIEDINGVDQVACVTRDITEKVDADRSLRLFRALIDGANDAVEIIEPETLRFLDVNDRACTDLGYSREELLALTVYDIDPQIEYSTSAAIVSELRSTGSLVKERIQRRKDGSTFAVETSLKLVHLDRSYIVAVSRDISDRQHARYALWESEDHNRDRVEHSEDLVCTHDLQGNLLSAGPAAARVLGYSVEELLNIPMRTLVAPEFCDQFDAYLETIKRTGTHKGLICVVTRTGGRRIWEYKNTLHTEGVLTPVVRGMAHDITERKLAVDALLKSEERMRLFIEYAPAGAALFDREMRYVQASRRWRQDYGLGDRELTGISHYEVFPEIPERWKEAHRRCLAGEVLREERDAFVRADGTVQWLRWELHPWCEKGHIGGIAIFSEDVTEQEKAAEALRRSEEHFRILVEQASDGIAIADADGRWIDVNSAWAAMLGCTRQEILGKKVGGFVVAEDQGRVKEQLVAVQEGHAVTSEFRVRRKDGSLLPVEVSAKRLPDGGLQVISRDITERKRTEDILRQNEERFRVALKDSPITVFNQDRELRYTWIYNPQLHWQEDVLGMTDEEILGPRKASILRELKLKVLKTGVAVREEVAIPKNGSSQVFDVTIEPLFDSEKNIVGITAACMDIARLREMADRLQEATDRLSQEKSYLESQIQSELGFAEIIGRSPALCDVLKKARIVAATNSTVLLLGETGTGKELVARSVHGLSPRQGNTFVKLNCAAVPSGLLESELFGHEKGAFTGAVNQKVGRIELADKGTLFLDEIGELPLELQPKLLRVLQDREFERLGGVRTIRVDVRIIAATNRDLRQDIADRKFREDLFYRLNVFPIELPALRDRRDDISLLVEHFVKKHSERMGKNIDTIPEGAMQVLRNWGWPGNIRELENMIERMVILTKGNVLVAPPSEIELAEGVGEDNLTEMEREHIIRILRETNGVLSGEDGAAIRLGLKRTTLQSMIKRLGIEPQEYRTRANGTYGRS